MKKVGNHMKTNRPIDTIRKYAEYFLINNREVMEPDDITELEQGLKAIKETDVRDWISNDDPGVYVLSNIKISGTVLKTSCTADDLQRIASERLGYEYTLTDGLSDDILMSYYRSQLFIFHEITYDKTFVSPYTDKAKYIKLIKESNNMTPQPYSYVFDDGAYDDMPIPTTDEPLVYTVPDEWCVVIPAALHESRFIFNDKDREKADYLWICEILLKTLPITIVE